MIRDGLFLITHKQITHTNMNLLKREREFGFLLLLLLKSWTSSAVVDLPLVVTAEIKTKQKK